MSFEVILWSVLFQALTPNPVAFDAGPIPFIFAMLFVTLSSLFMVSILIGVLTAGIEDRVRSLRKGRSRVLENDHTVILGWGDHIFTIISELIEANVHRPKSRACIVVLGHKDKVVMEEEIRQKLGHIRHTRIVCRNGDPVSPSDLEIVSVNTARSVIILGPEGDDPDASVIKTLLAIVNNPDRRPEPYHIVTEIHDPSNIEAARLAGGPEAEVVLTSRLTSRIIAQTCRRSGLSTVYSELLSFRGNEIYFQTEPAIIGRTFGEALFVYETSAVIGIRPADGKPKLNPPMGTILHDGDQIIAISEDYHTIELSDKLQPEIDTTAICDEQRAVRHPEHTLIVGWNVRAREIIEELDHYVAPGSQTTVAAEDATLKETIAGLQADLVCQRLEFVICNSTDRRDLDRLNAGSYQRIIVLAYSDTLPQQKADARTLMTLLHLRDIAKLTSQPFTIVSEMLDERNRKLAEVTRADDFVMSEQMAGLLLTQISENKGLHEVFNDIFDEMGSEVYLKPASEYVKTGVPHNFYTVVEAARRRGDVAFGYRICAHANEAALNYGIVINPEKSRHITFTEQDRIIVLSEKE